jgi:hypothetical protein
VQQVNCDKTVGPVRLYEVGWWDDDDGGP